ncbi:unnamed protein product [Lupinus luteus]|uniref:Uncharacterized protein n=1 Tax=Lupinus luteus TaxID=3873 RepID=A0AAV1YMM5_LUPLU
MSNLVFMPFFVLPGTTSKVPRRISNILFSICITSRKYLTYNELQYDNSKNIDIFFHPSVIVSPSKNLPKLLFKPFRF